MKKPVTETHDKKAAMKRSAFILFFITVCCLLSGQVGNMVSNTGNGCLNKIKEADRYYQDGIYDKCIDVLKDTFINCSLTRNERTLALELLAKAYTEYDYPERADSVVNLMLQNSPHYELKEPGNPESYNRLIKKYKVHPRLSVGIRNTLDWMNYKTTKIFNVNGLQYNEPYKKELEGILNDFNWMYYGWAELEFDGDISLNCDLIFKWTNFKREIGTPDFDLTFKEQDNYIEIPLYIKKYFHAGKYVLPYITAGMGWLYMTKATGNATKDYPDDVPSVTTEDINMLSMRNRNTFEWIAGAGLGYKLKNLRLFIDVRYYGGTKSITNPEKGTANSMLFNDYRYIDNSVRFNQFELGASVSYTFINSVKRIRQ
jgi:hypothetical protein